MRFAVVLYGGVSLAIYINGVVQELLNLVRATAPDRPPRPGAAPPRPLLTGGLTKNGASTAAVYRELGQLARWGQDPEPGTYPKPTDPILTRFVVDIISGTSAGGLNGIFLAKALANEQQLDGLKNLWVGESDITKLVNDEESYQGLAPIERLQPVESLLNSRRLFYRLLGALSSMKPDRSSDSRLVEELDLWVTATDLKGLELPLDLFDKVISERRYKNVFRFVYRTSYAAGALGGGQTTTRNDFRRKKDAALAFAGRCTSSFPAAFDPMMLHDIDAVLAASEFSDAYPGATSAEEWWKEHFPDYGDLFRTASFADGGYLDNKPFTWATETLTRRRSDRPVDRRLIYIEPDPHQATLHRSGSGQAQARERPDIFENVFLAAHKLPRAETIREDLQRLTERNREVSRVQGLTRLVDELGADAWEEFNLADWRSDVLATDSAEHVQYRAYRRLKILTVLDELAEVLTLLAGFNPDSDDLTAIRCLAQAWYERQRAQAEDGIAYDDAFLGRFDLSFRLRRLNFVQARIDELLQPEGFGVQDVPPEEASERGFRDVLHVVKSRLNDVFTDLRARGRLLRSRSENQGLAASLDATLESAVIRGLLEGARTSEESVERARLLLESRAVADAVDGVADGLAEAIETHFQTAHDDALAALTIESFQALNTPYRDAERQRLWLNGVERAGAVLPGLRSVFQRYEVYDSFILPVSYGVVGETDRVEVIRISPVDATSIVDELATGTTRRKLGGSELGHFGGFFSVAWRRNDILWGRLDAAERIIETILPPRRSRQEMATGDAREQEALAWRDTFLTRAKQIIVLDEVQSIAPQGQPTSEHWKILRAIFGEEMSQADLTDPERLLGLLAMNEVDRRLPQSMQETVGRGATVLGRVLTTAGWKGVWRRIAPALARAATAVVAGAAKGLLGWPIPGALFVAEAAGAGLVLLGHFADGTWAARTGWGAVFAATMGILLWLLTWAAIRKQTATGWRRFIGQLIASKPTWIAFVLLTVGSATVYVLALFDGKGASWLLRHLPGWI